MKHWRSCGNFPDENTTEAIMLDVRHTSLILLQGLPRKRREDRAEKATEVRQKKRVLFFRDVSMIEARRQCSAVPEQASLTMSSDFHGIIKNLEE